VAAPETAAAVEAAAAPILAATAPEPAGPAAPAVDAARIVPRLSRRPAVGTAFATQTRGSSPLGAGGAARPIHLLTTQTAEASDQLPGNTSDAAASLAARPSSDTAEATATAPTSGLPASFGAATAQTAANLQDASNAQSVAAAAAMPGAAATAPRRATAADSVAGAAAPADLAASADKMMSQVVQTIHTYQTSSGPAVEARVSDANLGDVKLVVTGRAGEIVQAQLFVRDRVSADALTAAAARVHATGDGLVGVNVTVRSEAGGSWTSSGRGGSSESAAWSAGGGWGSGSSSSAGHGDAGQGPNAGSQTGTGSGSGSGQGAGTAPDGSRGSQRPVSAPLDHSAPIRPAHQQPRTPVTGGPSLDIRA
jgi:hypothetical protein